MDSLVCAARVKRIMDNYGPLLNQMESFDLFLGFNISHRIIHTYNLHKTSIIIIIFIIITIIIISSMTRSIYSSLTFVWAKSRRGIPSYVACIGQVNPAKPICLQIKPQPISSNLKALLGFGDVDVDSIGITLRFGFTLDFTLGSLPPKDAVSPPHWMNTYLWNRANLTLFWPR